VPSDKRQRQREGRQARQQAAQAERRRAGRRRQLVAVVIVVAVVALIFVTFNRGSSKKNDNPTVKAGKATTTTTAPSGPPLPCPNPDGTSPKTQSFPAPPPMCIDVNKTYTATMKTTKGTMTIALDPKQAPKTVNNFVYLARYHFFDGVSFHRIIPGFVVQGGDPKGDGTGGPGYKFADELPKAGEYKVGSLAMANSGPNTNGSQFFIIVGPQGVGLPPQYSLFGMVTDGIDVAHALEAEGTDSGTPKDHMQMDSVTIAES
jgi:cyclophilin family peptidyl-prolyl cis-trans isomerase